jgi:type IV secretion system protein VirB3
VEGGAHISQDPEGYRVPIHQSLTVQHLTLGIPRGLCILIWTFCVAMSMPLHTWYAIPPTLFVHIVAKVAAERDPQFWDVFVRAMKHKVLYRA